MKKFEITIMKNKDEGAEEIFWLPVNEDALVEELDDRHE